MCQLPLITKQIVRDREYLFCGGFWATRYLHKSFDFIWALKTCSILTGFATIKRGRDPDPCNSPCFSSLLPSQMDKCLNWCWSLFDSLFWVKSIDSATLPPDVLHTYLSLFQLIMLKFFWLAILLCSGNRHKLIHHWSLLQEFLSCKSCLQTP